jgi:hypothetical protein
VLASQGVNEAKAREVVSKLCESQVLLPDVLLDVMKLPEFEKWRNELLEEVIVVEPVSRILQVYAWIIELLTLYFSVHIPTVARAKGQEYLNGKCGDVVRINLTTRRIHFKWNRLATFCARQQTPERQVEDLRLYIEKEGTYLDEKEKRGGWWRCTWGCR